MSRKTIQKKRVLLREAKPEAVSAETPPPPPPAPPLPDPVPSPHWPRQAKLVISIALLILGVLIIYRFSTLMRYLVMAAILSYLLNPVISGIAVRLPGVRRVWVVLGVYAILFALFVRLFMMMGGAIYSQVLLLANNFPRMVQQAVQFVQSLLSRTWTISLGGFEWELAFPETEIDINRLLFDLQLWAQSSWNTLLAQGGSVVGGVAQITLGFLGLLGTLVFIFALSIYISLDSPKIGRMVGDMAQPPGYRADAERLFEEFGRIWRAYLRGQIILALTMGSAVYVVLTILGVNYALPLAILTGAVEFLPMIGAPIAAGITILVALFQQSNWLGLTTWQYVLLIAVVMLIMQQLENNLLVPRIVGQALDLHPLVTLMAVFMGSSLAGILGAILAAPVTATAKLLGIYIWRKLFDLEPFPNPPPPPNPAGSFGITLPAWLRRDRS
jgi:predicted PurR-regulated permease PerM